MKLSTAIALVMVLAISAIFLVRQSTAYRDASRPIQDLAATADLIVLADVEQVTSAGDRETAGGAAMPPGTDQVARLRVRETWKGPPTAVVEVAFNDFVKWPAPPAYASGETVVAFLRRAGPEWTTIGISAGIVDAGRGGLADLRQAVEKVARRAEDPALDAIAAEFVEHPPADATLPETLKRLAGRPDAGVDRAAITALESVLDRPQAPPWARDALALVLTRLGDRDPEARLAALNGIATRDDTRRARAILCQALKELRPGPASPFASPTGGTDATAPRVP